MTNYELIKIKKENKIATLTLNHAPVNALTPKLLGEIETALGELENDPEVRALIITGSGSYAFCAGADLKEFTNLDPNKAADVVKLGHRVFGKVANFPWPTVAAVNSLCLGGGNELAMACDMRIASDRARFGQPEVWIGLIPAWGGTQRMSRLIGAARAKELIFTGQMINAQEAFRIGLVNKVVPDGEEVRAATDICRMINAKSAPIAVRESKKAINMGLQSPEMGKALEYEVQGAVVVAKTEDLREGIEAFLAKRQPEFKGK